MDQLVIEAKTRKETGKKISNALRAAGRIPAVMYNEKAEAVSLDVDGMEFNKAWRTITATTLVTLKVDGTAYDAFIKDTEYDIKSDKVLHADFYVVDNKKEVTAKFKVHYTGTPAGVLKGGFMVTHVPEVTIKCLPKTMPARPPSYLVKTVDDELSSAEQKNICKNLMDKLDDDSTLTCTDNKLFIYMFYKNKKSKDI